MVRAVGVGDSPPPKACLAADQKGSDWQLTPWAAGSNRLIIPSCIGSSFKTVCD